MKKELTIGEVYSYALIWTLLFCAVVKLVAGLSPLLLPELLKVSFRKAMTISICNKN